MLRDLSTNNAVRKPMKGNRVTDLLGKRYTVKEVGLKYLVVISEDSKEMMLKVTDARLEDS